MNDVNGQLLIIYLMIGLAYALSHAMTCPTCRRVLIGAFFGLGEGVIHLFGWPIFFAQALVASTMKKPESIEEKIARYRDRGAADVIEQKPGESMTDFIARAKIEIAEKTAARMTPRNEKGPTQ